MSRLVRMAILVFVMEVFVTAAFAFRAQTDIGHHCQFLINMIHERYVPPVLLYYLSLGMITGFSTSLVVVKGGAVILAGIGHAARFVLATGYLHSGAAGVSEEKCEIHWRAIVWSIGLLFIGILPWPWQRHWFLGQVPANVWHNDTVIFLWPLALLVFLFSLHYLERPSQRTLAVLSGCVAMSTLAKPSFFFCFAPVFPLMCIRRFGLRRKFFTGCLPVLVGALILLVQYLMIYQGTGWNKVTGADAYGPGGIGVEWMRVWHWHSQNPYWSIVASISWPLLFALAYPQRFFHDLACVYSFLLLLVGLLVYCVFYEVGIREAHNNFLWQANIANGILHLCLVRLWLKSGTQVRTAGFRRWMISVAFFVHVAAGLAYLVRVIVVGNAYGNLW